MKTNFYFDENIWPEKVPVFEGMLGGDFRKIPPEYIPFDCSKLSCRALIENEYGEELVFNNDNGDIYYQLITNNSNSFLVHPFSVWYERPFIRKGGNYTLWAIQDLNPKNVFTDKSFKGVVDKWATHVGIKLGTDSLERISQRLAKTVHIDDLYIGELGTRALSIEDLDTRGVRVFPKYATSNGTYGIEIYRKKTEEESEGEHDWEMVRESHIGTYLTRAEAMKKAVELGEEICKKYNF